MQHHATHLLVSASAESRTWQRISDLPVTGPGGAFLFLRYVALTAVPALIFLSCVEVGLRLIPHAIPLSVLRQFEPGMRSEIAARRALPRRADTTPLQRDDGGAPRRLWTYQPLLELKNHDDEAGMAPLARMDAKGMCNSPVDLYDTDRFDLIALGDSFTFCTTVEPGEAWPARLAALTGLDVYNTGIPGSGLYEYVQMLKHFGLAKHPASVVMAVYEGNDFRDAHQFHRDRISDGDAHEVAVCAFSWGAVCAMHEALDATALRRHSHAYNLFSGSLHDLALSLGKREIDFGYEVSFSDGEKLHFNSENSDRDEVQYARWLADGQLDPDLFEEALTTYADLAREHGFTSWVVYVPSAHTAYEGMSRFDDPAVGALLREYSLSLRRYFRAKSEELGLRFFDATPGLQRASRELPANRRLYFQSNVHLTPEGHEQFAALVAQELHDVRR